MRKGHSTPPPFLTPPSSPTFKETLPTFFDLNYSLEDYGNTPVGLNTPPPSPTRPTFRQLSPIDGNVVEPQPLNAAKLFLQLRRKSSLAKIQAQKEKAARVVEKEEAQSGRKFRLLDASPFNETQADRSLLPFLRLIHESANRSPPRHIGQL